MIFEELLPLIVFTFCFPHLYKRLDLKTNKVFKQFKKYIYQAFDAAAMLLMLFTGQLVLISVKNPN